MVDEKALANFKSNDRQQAVSNPVEAVVILHTDRIAVLEEIANNYLLELTDALAQAKAERVIYRAKNCGESAMAVVKEQGLQCRVDALMHKLKRVDAI